MCVGPSSVVVCGVVSCSCSVAMFGLVRVLPCRALLQVLIQLWAVLVDVLERLNEIVNPPDLSLRDRQRYQNWLVKEYQLGILLKKLDERQ